VTLADPEIEAWFARIREPARSIIRRAAVVLVSADPAVHGYLKYGTLQIGSEGDLVNFVQVGRMPVSLMFNRGSRLRGEFPHLEGSGPSARFMRFGAVHEVDLRADELRSIVAAWLRFERDGA